MFIKNIFYGLIVLTFYTSCAKNEKSPFPIRQKIILSDLTNFKTFLPDGEYAYDVTVKDIILTPMKNAFEVIKEKYGVPEKVDGLKLKFSFDITNPYDREMQMPFPEYFEITADEFKGMDDYIYSKQCHYYISNAKEITDQKENPLSSFSKYTDVSIGRVTFRFQSQGNQAFCRKI